jgi:threonylcarbamoyladenosine tRNA methylthiotransferase MtaB
LLDLIAASDIICPHLHICAQAGHDAILKQMRRNYDTSFYAELLQRVRQRLPDAALGSDIIVGFPGESEAQFEQSLEYFDSLPLTYFHVFPYSPRRGTPAALLADQLSGRVKRTRARRMRELGARKKQDFCASFIGKRLAVLIEERIDSTRGWRRGFSRNYLPVVVAGADGFLNQEVNVRIDGWENGWLTAAVRRKPAATATQSILPPQSP